jgi:hypothetical protein
MNQKRIRIIVTILAFLIIVLTALFYNTSHKKLYRNFTMPILLNNIHIYDIYVLFKSDLTDIFAGEDIFIKVRISEINVYYYEEVLKGRKLAVVFEGTNPYENQDLIKLDYLPEKNEYVGEGKIKYVLPGNHKILIGTSYDDPIHPRERLGESHFSIMVLPFYLKYEIETNQRILILTKLVLIVAIISVWLGIIGMTKS